MSHAALRRRKHGPLWPPYTPLRRVCGLLKPGLPHLSVSDYYSKMCQYADGLAAVGMPLHDDELIAYLLAGLDEEYNSMFTSVVGRTDPIAPTDL
jgi:hypothetical protein